MASESRRSAKSTGWTDRQWKAVRSPQRVHLLAALEAFGEATVSEVAELTGRTRQSIYPHLEAMARVGIVGTGTRLLHGRRIATFRFLPEVLAGHVDQATGRGLRAAVAVAAGALSDAQKRCRRWGEVSDGRPVDLSRNSLAVMSIRVSWLDDRLRARLNGHLRKAAAVLRQGCARRKGRRTCVLLYHFPDYTAAEARRALRPRQSHVDHR